MCKNCDYYLGSRVLSNSFSHELRMHIHEACVGSLDLLIKSYSSFVILESLELILTQTFLVAAQWLAIIENKFYGSMTFPRNKHFYFLSQTNRKFQPF